MSYVTCFAVVALLLAGCVELSRPAGPPRTTENPASTVTVLNYPISKLPMSDPVRVQTVMTLSQLPSSDARRMCSAEELEYVNLSIILYAVREEEWRTSPWTARQKREVETLQRRWQVLGGDVRTVSPTCQKFVAPH